MDFQDQGRIDLTRIAAAEAEWIDLGTHDERHSQQSNVYHIFYNSPPVDLDKDAKSLFQSRHGVSLLRCSQS